MVAPASQLPGHDGSRRKPADDQPAASQETGILIRSGRAMMPAIMVVAAQPRV